MADLVGELATHRHSHRRPVTFSHVTLDLRDVREWRQGLFRLHRESGEVMDVSSAHFSAMSASGSKFSVLIPSANDSGDMTVMAEAIVTGIPASADCLVFSRRPDGFWEGVTVSLRTGRIAVVPYACDPS